jgi:hypothetical protein
LIDWAKGVGRGVADDHRAGPVEEQGGGRAVIGLIRYVVGPAVVKVGALPVGKAVARIEAAAAAAGQAGGFILPD